MNHQPMLDNDLLPDVSYTTWEVYEEALRYLESKGNEDESA